MPTRVAPHKRIEDDPGAEVRAEMARRAAESDGEWLEVSDLELRREGRPSYTYATLEAVRDEAPDAEVWWLMGADAALGLPSWKRPERVVELARLGIARRDGVEPAELEAALERVGAGEADVAVIEMPTVAVSSSAVRERVRGGRSIRDVVPEAVAHLISERGLYGG